MQQKTLTIVLILVHFAVYAQPASFVFDHYSIKDGLSSNETRDIAQDESGFIWIATRAGLNRFDGKDFVKYYGDGSPGHLPSNDISRVVRYSGPFMLIGTLKGLALLNTHSGIVQQLIIPAAAGLKKYSNTIIDIVVDSGRNIIVSTLGGLYVFDTAFHLSFRYDAYSASDLGKKRIQFAYCIYLLPNGKVLVPAAGKLNILDVTAKRLTDINQLPGNEWELLKPWSSTPSLLMNWTARGHCIIIDYKNSRSSIHANEIDFVKKTISRCFLPFPVKNDLQWKSKIGFINDSLLCINSSSQNGLCLLNFHQHAAGVGFAGRCLAGVQCNNVFTDRDLRLWISTDDGIYKQSFFKNNFHNTLAPTAGKIPDIDNFANGFATTDNGVLVSAFSSGLLKYNRDGRLLGQLIPKGIRKKNQPWNISSYAGDTLLVATQGGALLLNTKTNTVHKFCQPGMPPQLDMVPITSSLSDSHHQLWMGMGAGFGVFMFNRYSLQWKQFLTGDTKNSFCLRYPLSISEDIWGNIWMSGNEGITRWNQSKKIFDTVITQVAGIGDEITGQWISSVADKTGNLWICPEDFVLIKVNLQNNRVHIFHLPQEIGPLRVHQLKGPWNNYLWMSTSGGLLCFNTETEKFILLNKTDGLPEENAIEGNTYFDNITGRIYAGFNNAFTWFYPEAVLKKKSAVNTFITGIYQIGDSISKTGNAVVNLSHNNNAVSISFTGINYDNGESNTYAYRLFEDHPGNWINTGGLKTVYFANLKPGSYTFEVKTIVSDGSANPQPAMLSLNVAPAFYQTRWFYLLSIFLVASVVYGVYRYRINQLLKLHKVRNNISSDLHDDIGARLTNINLLTMLSGQNLQHPEITGPYLTRIAGEIQSSGQALDDIVWSINSSNDSISEIIARMRRYAAEIFETNGIAFRFNTDKKFPERNIAMEQRRDLFLTYKEAITNIQKHAAASEVVIQIHTGKKYFSLTIGDNGKGFDILQPTHRNGLKNMRRRIEKWKGRFDIISSRGVGTTIFILMP